MAPTKMPAVDDLASSVTSSSLLQYLPRNLIDIEILRVRAPLSNERIGLSYLLPLSSVDAQQGCNLVFFLKQHEFGLTFLFTPFFF